LASSNNFIAGNIELGNPILMKAQTPHLYTHSKYAKVLEWGKLITITGGAQAVVQAIGLVSGILVIRLLPTQEYALYTLANTMLGTMILLADGGISTGVMAQGGKVWQNREKLGSVLTTGLDLRKKFAIGSLLIAMPVLLYLLLHHGASWLMSLLIIMSLIPAFFTGLSGTLLQIVPKLRQDITPLQKIQVGSNVGRLAMLCLTLFIFPWSFIAILGAGLPQIWANIQFRKISDKYVDWNQKPDPIIRKDILYIVSRILPGAIYYCISGQIAIWLSSFFASTAAVAQVGALGRLAMLLSLFTVLFGTLITPRFARLPTSKDVLLNHYLLIHAGLLALSGCIIGVVWVFPTEVLWILGKGYFNLSKELLLNITGSCLNLIYGVSFTLYSGRGWAIKPIIAIPISLASMVISVILCNLTTLQGILVLNLLIAGTQVLMHFLYGLIKIVKVRELPLMVN